MKRAPVLLTAASLAVVTLVGSGCVQQRRFRFVPTTTACFPETATETAVAGPADQKPSLDCRSALYKLAFIEFDESGKLFDPHQEEAARKLLGREKERANNGKVITVVYVHGWKNNAAEAAPGSKPKDVEKFQAALLELGYRADQTARAGKKPPVPVVGIYMAWRGKTLMGPSWFTAASLWSRRNTANNIGDGPDLARILNDIIDRTNAGNDHSRVLLVGHSFGARVLEHALESKDLAPDGTTWVPKVKLYDEVTGSTQVRPRVDLVLYVNSANDSRLAMGRVQALKAAGLRVHHPDYDPAECAGSPKPGETIDQHATRCRDYPLLVAIMSKGDQATKYLLPIANTINGDSLTTNLEKSLPPLPTTNDFADPTPTAGKVRKVSAGHFGFLQSHAAREITCPAVPSQSSGEQAKTTEATIDEAVRRAVAEALGLGAAEQEKLRRLRDAAEATRRREEERVRYERAMHPVCDANDLNCRFKFRTLGDRPTCYQVDQRQEVDGKLTFNDTPFWVMDVETSVMKDYGDIWNVSFVEMLGQLMAPRGFFDPDMPRVQIRAVPASK